MKIVEINTVCDTGSTGRIAAGVARLAEKQNHEVWFAYGRGKHPPDIRGYKIGDAIDFACHVLLNFYAGKSGFGSKRVTKHFLSWLDTIQPDILHLHNLHGFYINVELLFDYIKKRDIPVIWTFHDCWPFTGQCAYFDAVGCDKWKVGCHDCPIYRTNYPYSLFCDNSKNNYHQKEKIFRGVKNLTIITPSNWLANLVDQSFLKEYSVKVIHNGIDISLFAPTKVNRWDKKVILGVANVWTKNKGIEDFFELAERLPDSCMIVLIGVSDRLHRKIERQYSEKILGIKHTNSIKELAVWYNIADVFVNPTREDNFPTTNIEALACGTPVITYASGGSPESVNNETGMVIEKGDVDALTRAIETILFGENYSPELCRKQGECFDMNNKLAEYVDLLQSTVV